MKTNPLKEGVLIENSAGIGTVTPKMVRERAVELAVINGRSASEVSKSDRDQAKRELTGEPETDPNEAALESAPESERWDPVPGSTGQKVPVAAGEDEDEEGRSDNERLVEEGVAEAEHDQMLLSRREKPVKKTGGAAGQIKIVIGIALLAALTGCVGYVDGGGGVVVGGPVVVGGAWEGGFAGRDVVHGYSSRGAASRSVAHSAGRGGGRR